MITITVTQDNKTLTISQPDDIPLTETNDSYYSWKHVFAVILFWLTYTPDTINSVMPDCEECDALEELNREHNAELEERCNECEYKKKALWYDGKTDGVNDGLKDGVKNCYNCDYRAPHKDDIFHCTCPTDCEDFAQWKQKENVQNVQDEAQEEVSMEVNEENTCDNCKYVDLEETEEPCKECVEDDDTVYGKWTPKDITDEKETVKKCDNCQYGHTEQLSAECFGCVEAKTQVLTHWQPVSANVETTGKSEIKGWINRDIEL